ncbi:hypothetical protein Smp_193990 [Schistosoma mansoni]|uniref:hypothetical protein n=1 Tax=Schistosoma mansoni TaxID=6183 RepID=UPI00022DC1B6|nr:hypothetical protein Smp_193990 [Schistosoma mansoni]|eukprot:XP_018652841.1 hypothetical protein Smp_193990 [Schistosoma mansoni]
MRPNRRQSQKLNRQPHSSQHPQQQPASCTPPHSNKPHRCKQHLQHSPKHRHPPQ